MAEETTTDASGVDDDVLALLAEIERLHEITSRDGDVWERQALREGHHASRTAGQRRSRGRSETPQQQQQQLNGNGNSLVSNCSLNRVSFFFGFSIILFICVGTPLVNKLFEHILGMRCFVPNNYLVWEATRPKSDCSFCRGYDGPIILPNMTMDEFEVSSIYMKCGRKDRYERKICLQTQLSHYTFTFVID